MSLSLTYGTTFVPMLFSVVMPSFLGPYANAASNREEKFIRAVQSVVDQSYASWELQIVADGCDRTMELMAEHFPSEPRWTASLIAKQPKWHPAVRNCGIYNSTGEWILYLDTDDQWGPDHLSTIAEALEKTPPPNGWAYFNDFAWDPRTKEWVERRCEIDKKYAFGTSNFIHRRDLNLWWPKGTYDHDFAFGQVLKKAGPGIRLATPAYLVCHVPTGPNKYDL